MPTRPAEVGIFLVQGAGLPQLTMVTLRSSNWATSGSERKDHSAFFNGFARQDCQSLLQAAAALVADLTATDPRNQKPDYFVVLFGVFVVFFGCAGR